jgi:hypothetical protein
VKFRPMTDSTKRAHSGNSAITGAPSGRNFERSCYCVRNHQDGTGTIVLDWYEMSVGRDYMTSEIYMRTELVAARQIVAILNRSLSHEVTGEIEVDDPII